MIPASIRSLVGLTVNPDGSFSFTGKLIARGLDIAAGGAAPGVANMIRWLRASDSAVQAEIYQGNGTLAPVGHAHPALILQALQPSPTGSVSDNAQVIAKADSGLDGTTRTAVILDGSGNSAFMVGYLTGRVTGAAPPVIVDGAGFSVARTAAGVYTITFDTAFAAVPLVLVQSVNGTSQFTVRALTVNGFTLTEAGAHDRDFHFLAAPVK